MQQLFAVLLALLVLPVLLKWKIPSGWAILFIGISAGLTAGLPAQEILGAFGGVVFTWSSLSSVLTVIQIALLGKLMTQYGLFRRAEEALKQVIPAPKIIIMMLPSIIGILQVPGGAALSAPFCNSIGRDMGLSKSQRSNTNVICRHVFSLFLPISAWVIQINDLVPGLEQSIFIPACLCFAGINVAANRMVFLRKTEEMSLPRFPLCTRLRAMGVLLTMLSPILTVIALNAVAGIPVVFCVPFGVLMTYLLSDHTDFPKRLWRSLNGNLAMMIISVYFFQNIVKRMDQLLALGSSLLTGGSQAVFLLGTALIAVLFGMATGLIYVSLGVLLPIVVRAFPGDTVGMTIAAFYVYCWSYIGYVFSPVHLCQLLSDKECGSRVGERYRTYLPMIILIPTSAIVLYWILSLLFQH